MWLKYFPSLSECSGSSNTPEPVPPGRVYVQLGSAGKCYRVPGRGSQTAAEETGNGHADAYTTGRQKSASHQRSVLLKLLRNI